MTMFRRTLLSAALAALMPVGMAHAVQINLDVQDHGTADANNPDDTIWIDPAADGVPALQNFSDQWNYHFSRTAGSTTALSDVSGTATGITFELLTATGSFTANNTQIGGVGPWDDAIRDLYFANGGVQSKLTGLDASGATTYDIYPISALFFGGNWQTITVTGGAGPSSANLSNPANGGASPQYFGGPIRLGGDYQEFLGVTADANGEILINIGDFNGGGGEGRFSGLQIVTHPVPEPATLALLGLGCIASFVTRRRS